MTLVVGTSAPDILSGGVGDDTIYGVDGADSLSGLDGADLILGGAGNDTITGDAGADSLDGGSGVDSLIGGSGNDVYYVDDTGDVVVELAGGGLDTVYSNASHTLSAEVEQLVLFGAAASGTGNGGDNNIFATTATGSVTIDGAAGNDWIQGSNQADTILGGQGADVIEGLGGANRLEGGAGDDVILSTSASDTIIETVGGGLDTLYANYDVNALAANVEQLVVYGASSKAIGNSGNNNIFANSASNAMSIEGGAGNDWILGSAQSDTIKGGADADVIEGGAGANRLDGGAGDDIIYSTSASDTVVEAVNDGFDTLYANYDVNALAANVEQLVVYGASTKGIGNSGNNNIFGNASGNSLLLDGGDGNDWIIGSAQSDTILGGEGNDTVMALAGGDSVSGGNGDDEIFGGAGADVLDGGAGHNRAWYVESASGVNVSLASGTGSGGDAAGDQLSNIQDLIGSTHDDTLVGDGADNILYGLAGSDVLAGGGGADSLVAGQGGDALDGGAGSDALFAEQGDDELSSLLAVGDTDFFFGGEGGETDGDVAVIDGNSAITTYLVGGNGLGFTYVGDGESANTFVMDVETIDLVTGASGDDVEIADGIGVTGTHTLLVSTLDGHDTVTVTSAAPTGLSLLQVMLGEGDDSFDFSKLEAGTDVIADGGQGNDSFTLHAGAASIVFDFQGSGGLFGDDNVINFDTTLHELVFQKGSALVFQVLDQLNADGSHLLTAVADGATVGSVNVSGSFVFANDVVIQ